MENIYRTWDEFNKVQQRFLNTAALQDKFRKVTEVAAIERKKNYPTGELWRYVDFKALPITKLHWPPPSSENKQVVSADFIHFKIQDFHEIYKIETVEIITGLHVLSEGEAVELGLYSLQDFNYDNNPFFGAGYSFLGQGMTIDINETFSDKRPLKVTFDLGHLKSKDLYVHFNLNIRSQSSAKVLIDIQGENFSGVFNLCVNAEIMQQAQLQIFTKEWGGAGAYNFYNLQAFVHQAGFFEHYDMTFPSLLTRHSINVDLVGPQARTRLQGIYLNSGDFFSDHHTLIRHMVGYTESQEDYRGVVTDKAQSVFNGKIFIAKKSSHSKSELINKNLMLSEKAQINTKPELQIYNDDVKASHGATIGRLDEEQKFYLQSRGFSEKEALKTLVKAFVFDVLDQIDLHGVDFYLKELEESLNNLEGKIYDL